LIFLAMLPGMIQSIDTPDFEDALKLRHIERLYQIGRLTFPIGFLVHGFFIWLFTYLDVLEMAYFNAGSTLLWVSVYLLIGRTRFIFTLTFLIFLEVLLHALMAIYYVGPNLGFHYWLIAFVPSTALLFGFSFWRRIILSAAFVLAFVACVYYGQNYPPVYPQKGLFVDVLGIVNLLSAVANVAFISHVTKGISDKAEIGLALAHAQSEELLHNILPEKIASRLKKEGRTIADGFAQATILFADIVGFTKFSQTISPGKLVAILNDIFSRFDDLAEKHGLEKIKTIGDAYMVAAGIPEERKDHAQAMAQFALEMLDVLKAYGKETGIPIQIRVGINSGPVVAGVIGKRKFIYDLWGDSVNTAARMESHGESGQIQVTESTFHLLESDFNLTSRGAIEVKGKGKMTTYWLQSRHS